MKSPATFAETYSPTVNRPLTGANDRSGPRKPHAFDGAMLASVTAPRKDESKFDGWPPVVPESFHQY